MKSVSFRNLNEIKSEFDHTRKPANVQWYRTIGQKMLNVKLKNLNLTQLFLNKISELYYV